MKRDYEKILNSLPKDWSELKLWQYKQIEHIKIADIDEVDSDFVGQENTIRILSVLTDIPIEELRETTYSIIIPMAHRIGFIMQVPTYDKHVSSIEWKKIDEVSYDSFTTFLLLSADPMKHIVPIIKSFSVKEISEEEINQMSMLEVYAAFFTLKRYANRFIRTMYRHLAWKLLKQTMTQFLILPIRQKFRKEGVN